MGKLNGAYLAVLTALLLSLTACTRGTGLPQPDSSEYRDLVAAFYAGVAALQTGYDIRAQEKLTLATQLAANEPAPWANLGLLDLRRQEFEAASQHVEKARRLAPDNSRIEALLGLIEGRRGKLPEAIAHFKKAVELDSKNLHAFYALAEETEREGTPTGDAQAQQYLETILKTQPDNLAVLLYVARIAAKRGDGEALKMSVAKLTEQSASWPADARQQLSTLTQAASSSALRDAATQTAFLRNVLTALPAYRESLNAVKTPPELVAEPFLKFLRLPSPESASAEPDMAMSFESQAIPGLPGEITGYIGAVQLGDDGPPEIFGIDGRELRFTRGTVLAFPEVGPDVTPDSVLALDLNYDFRPDLVMAGAGGIKVYRQEGEDKFSDITSSLKLPAAALKAAYSGAWTLDVDLDGDLDVLLGALDRPPAVLRNNGNGSFDQMSPFSGINGLVSFAVGDIDGDGDPDAAMLDPQGVVHVYINQRLGQYVEQRLPQDAAGFSHLASADIDADGYMDFIALGARGKVVRMSHDERTGGLTSAELIPESTTLRSGSMARFRPYGLIVADLDNSGSLDLIVDGEIWLGNPGGGFQHLNLSMKLESLIAADINNDGRLDILGLSTDGARRRPTALINHGTRNYHFQIIRTRAAIATGDQRINSFGIGGEIEIRSGLLTQKQAITSPVLHFGLGGNTQTDLARIVWPNGSVQAEFELKADQTIRAEQRLKGSCPMLFAWDGSEMRYVKDTAPWSPALGLRINAQEVAGIYQTEEWFKIPGGSLAPRDGFYDLRVTAELWETFYIDHYSLMAIDHPAGTYVFADERFAVPPPPLKLYATGEPKPFAAARDDLGQDVSLIVRDLDQRYLDTFGKGQYQGVTRDHWVELEMPDQQGNTPIYLIGHGFLHPTDGSINVAYGQTGYPRPEGLSIETPDADGRWSTARSGLGFPAGKLKTIVLDLSGIFRPGAARKLRLRTNMEIYWDKLEWAEALPESTFTTQRIPLASAELRWRGFSEFTQANASSPELPDYNRLAGTTPRWRDLTGYYTRHGDVRELLEKVDNRMVIANAGDEIRLKFAAAAPGPAGWIRDYVMVGDGWIKDGDLNSTFSKTVLPLPYHGMKDYNAVPGRLEDDPAYRKHPEDWQTYHTRYVTPDVFLKALRKSY